MHVRRRLVLIAFLLTLAYALVYPRKIQVGGDQNAAVIAAQSLLQDGSYKVPLHEAYGPETAVEIGADLRQPLKWYPPGYTLVLFALAQAGLSLAAGALLTFYTAKFLWTLVWLAAGRAWRIPDGVLLGAVSFSLFLTYPTTNTDIWESIGIASVFLALAQRLGEPGSAVLASTSIAATTLFRYSGVKLLGFYGLVELLRRPRPATFWKTVLVGVLPAGVYLACTRLLAHDASPYHGVGPLPHTNWLLLPKGLYYAVMGGWSPTWLPIKALEILLLTLALAGYLLLARRKAAVPDWILLVLGFQVYYLCSLVMVQISFGSMYPYHQPAFATPRYIALAQPFSVAALLVLASVPLSRLRPRYKVLRAVPALVLLATALNWTLQNRWIMASEAQGPDGFLRFGDEDGIHRLLRAQQLDAVFDGTGVLMYTAVDPRRIYPDNLLSLHTGHTAHVALVRFLQQRNDLLDALAAAQVKPDLVLPVGRFEVDLFTLPAGLTLPIHSHRGFVPHV